MRTHRCQFSIQVLVVLLLAGAALDRASAAAPPQRLKRADSFLGIHFDFHAGPDCTEIGKNTTPRDDREHHRPGPSRLPPDRLQGPSRAVELSDQGRQPGARLRRRSAAALARGDRRARRGALHALLGRVGLRGHPPASRLGRGQRRRQDQRQRHLVLRPLRRPAADPATARTGRRLRRGRRVGRRRVLGLGAGLRRGGAARRSARPPAFRTCPASRAIRTGSSSCSSTARRSATTCATTSPR